MLSMAEVKPGEVVYDLGSGDGRILMSAVKEARARAVGIEVNPLWVLWTRLKIRILKVKDNARVVWGNFFREDLSKADIVTLYLLQSTNDKLKPKLERELRPGARVVSHAFTFNGWNPVKVDEESKIFVYKIEDKNQKEP
jgi:predicted RNA methylase